MRTKFKNASEAFDYFYIKIKDKGTEFDNTKALFNVGFYMARPLENKIKSGFRKWKKYMVKYLVYGIKWQTKKVASTLTMVINGKETIS